MEDKLVTELTALAAAPAVGDLFMVVDISDTTDDAGGTTKKITAANLFVNLVTLTGIETLTNKTLTSPTLNTATINNPVMTAPTEVWVVASDAATVTFNLAAGNKQNVTLGGNRTLALSNVQSGHVFLLRLKQDATGSRTVTWFSGISWAGGGTPPTLTTTANKADVFGFVRTGSNTYDGFIVGQNL